VSTLEFRKLIDTHGPHPLNWLLSVKFGREKTVKRPTVQSNLDIPHYQDHTINNTLAGVAQLVERVALITAKRSTSRSWVRAPPSAIPISKLIRAAVLLLFACQ
jgi:hypothetical protein